MKNIRAAILVISDKAYKGKREDTSGKALSDLLKKEKIEVVLTKILPDEEEFIIKELKMLADGEKADLVLTTGGTGLSPHDLTPEATLKVIEKEAPLIVYAMAVEGLKKTPYAMLSRARCGARKKTLIVNLPGSPEGACENLKVILPVLPHAIEVLKGEAHECAKKKG